MSKIKAFLLLVGGLCLVALFHNCGGGGYNNEYGSGGKSNSSSNASPEWQVIAPVFQQRCYSCHGPGGMKPMNIFDEEALAQNSNLVNLSSPQQSKIYTMVRDGVMPQSGNPLSSEQVAAVLDWVWSL